MLLSIIILSYNTASLTEQTIKSIYDSTKMDHDQFEIIVLDNASEDNSVRKIENLQVRHTNLKLMISDENLGFSKGNNKAAREAVGKYLLFLNSDIIVRNLAIDKLLQYKINKKDIGFLGGKLFNEDGSKQPSCGPFYSLPVVFGALFLKGDYWGLTRYSPNKIKTVDWVSGACILTEKEIFYKVGKFDEKIFMYMEEIDLLFRAKKIGYQTVFYPEAAFIHLGSASSGGKSFPIIQVYRGFLYFYKKHYSKKSQTMLKVMLQLKALVAIFFGRILGKFELIKTYEKALKIVEMD